MTDTTDVFSIAGKRTLITGGTAGIGLGVAEHFVGAGAPVVITGRRESGAEIAERIGAQFVRMDVADPESARRSTDEAAGLLGGLDVAILNAGVGPPADVLYNLSFEDFRRTFDVNVYGVMYTLRAALEHMGDGASVIVSSSPAATVFTGGMSAYCASKAALNAAMRIWAHELGPRGIRVNAVLPGIVDTEMSVAASGGTDEEIEMIRTFTANGTVRQPSEMGPAYHFLASDASAPCVGALLEFDDGISAGFSQALLAKAFGE